jgi:hypothetical protein
MTISNNWLLNDSQNKILRLSRTYRTLVTMGYPPDSALREISRGFSLNKEELTTLIKFLTGSLSVDNTVGVRK